MTATARRVRSLGLLPVLILPWLPACSGDEPTPPPPPSSKTVNEVVAEAGWFPTLEPDSVAFAVDRFDSTGGAGENLSCRVYEGEQLAVVPCLTILAPTAVFGHAGAILQYASLADPAPLAVVADRAGADLVLAAPGGGEVTGSVPVVDAATVEAWRQAALLELGAVPPGPWAMTVASAYAPDHVALLAGVSPAAFTAEVSARLAFGDEAWGRALVRLVRPHHVVAATWPGSASRAFAPDVTGDDVDDQMEPGNPPVWVDEVAHGQLLLVLVESTASPAEVAAAAARSFAAAADGETPAAGPLLQDLPDLAVKVFAAGADPDAAEAAALAGQQALTDFLQAAPGPASSLPAVTASVAALRNGGPVDFAITAEFGLTACEIYEPVFDTVLWGYEARDAQTIRVVGDLRSEGLAYFDQAQAHFYYEGGSQQFTNEEVNYVLDLKGSGGAASWAGRRPFLIRDALNGHPVIELYELAIPAGVLASELRFDGSSLVGRDYTIFLVMGMPSNVRLRVATASGTQYYSQLSLVNYFLHGTGVGQRHNLLIGHDPFEGDFDFEHTNFRLETTLARQIGWHTYAFRFGIAEGMAIFVDGQLIDEDPYRSETLLEFSGATFCTRWFGYDGYKMGIIWLAEIVAYRDAGSNEMITAEFARLQAKYGL